MQETDDLYLKALGQFIGSQQYHKVLGANVTDGVRYIMENGYAWFVTDSLAVILFTPKLRREPFLTVELKRAEEGNEADLIITDGNEKTLYTQHYEFTDAKRDLKLYCENGVLLLNSEH